MWTPGIAPVIEGRLVLHYPAIVFFVFESLLVSFVGLPGLYLFDLLLELVLVVESFVFLALELFWTDVLSAESVLAVEHAITRFGGFLWFRFWVK